SLLGDRRQMIRRRGAKLGGQLGASGRLQLVGVQLETESAATGCIEDAARLVESEHSGLAKHVGEPSDSLLNHLRQQILDQQIDVRCTALVTRSVVVRNLVSTHPRGYDSNGVTLGQSPDYP